MEPKRIKDCGALELDQRLTYSSSDPNFRLLTLTQIPNGSHPTIAIRINDMILKLLAAQSISLAQTDSRKKTVSYK